MTNEATVINYLRWYYNATPVIVRVQDFNQYFARLKTQSPSFVDNFASAARGLNISKIQAAMVKLGQSASKLEYMPSPYFEALASTGTALSIGDVASAAGAGVLEAGEKLTSLASTSLMIYAGIAAFGVYILPKLLKGK